jgi:hypothetical protein
MNQTLSKVAHFLKDIRLNVQCCTTVKNIWKQPAFINDCTEAIMSLIGQLHIY